VAYFKELSSVSGVTEENTEVW